MIFPDSCPNCGAIPKTHPASLHNDRRAYACGTWIIESRKGVYTSKTDTCDDWRTIKEAAAVICAFLDADPEARQKGQDWLDGNMP